MTYLSIVIPAYNEEKAIGKVLEDVLKNAPGDYEVIVVDDGSRDNTAKITRSAKSAKIRLISHQTNKGKPEAIRTGVHAARGKIIVLMDADHTYPAKHVKEAVKKIEEGYDIVLGNRFAYPAKIPSLNKIGNIIFSILISYCTSTVLWDAQTGFRAFKKRIFDEIDVPAAGLEYETKQTINALYAGYGISEIPIEYRKRIGESKLNRLIDGYNMFRAIMSVVYANMSISTRFFVLLSALLFLIGSLFGAISLKEKIMYGVLSHGYFPIISTLAIVLSFQSFSLGIMLGGLNRQLDRIEKRLKRMQV